MERAVPGTGEREANRWKKVPLHRELSLQWQHLSQAVSKERLKLQ